MNPDQEFAFGVLRRLGEQLQSQLPAQSVYGGPLGKVELRDLEPLSRAILHYAQAVAALSHAAANPLPNTPHELGGEG